MYSSVSWNIEFNLYPGARIRNQYSNGLDGVTVLTGFFDADAIREEDPAGFLKIESNWLCNRNIKRNKNGT